MMQNILAENTQNHLQRLEVPLCLELPDGRLIHGAYGSHNTPKLTIKNWTALGDLISGELGVIGADLVQGRVKYEGSMRQLMTIAQRLIQVEPHRTDKGRIERFIESGLHQWRKRFQHSRSQDATHVQFHYDICDDFFALWLDPLRIYSCAYFEAPGHTLAHAQQAKLDLICRKLMLKEGDRFLDLGMGWGGLLIWAAQHYGVQATGITLSKNQYIHVHQQIQEKKLMGRIQIQLLDYRDVDETHPYDKVASVGMFEHVGRVNMHAYFSKIWRLLKPGGMLMNHGITAGWMGDRQIGLSMGDFIEKFIFPGGELLHVSEVMHQMARAHFEVVDVENLRPHYAQTLWAWSDRLEAQLDQARALLRQEHPEAAEKILQAYRLYLSGCAVGFERGWTALYQMLAIRNDAESDYPFTRDHLYRSGCVRPDPSILSRCLEIDESCQ